MADDEAQTESGNERLYRVITDYLDAVAAGKEPQRQELFARYPDLAVELAEFFADHDRMKRIAGPLGAIAAAAMSLKPDTSNRISSESTS